MTETTNPLLSMLGGIVSRQLDPQSIAADQWPEIIRLARQHGLGPLLWWVVKDTGPDRPDRPDRLDRLDRSSAEWRSLKTSFMKSAAHLLVLERAQGQIGGALKAVGIEPLWLKGFSLANTIYPEPFLRPMCDLDVLVPFAQCDEALKAVQSIGYRLFDAPGHLHSGSASLTQKMSHHYQLIGGGGNPVMLELHYRLFGAQPKILSLEAMEWFRAETRTMSMGNSRFCILKPEANLLYLIAHTVLHHREMGILLRNYLDLHLLITQSRIDWRLVLGQTAAFNWAFAVEKALKLIRGHFNTPIPDFVMVELRRRRPGAVDLMHVSVALEGGVRWEKMLGAFTRLRFVDRIRLGLRVVFPPPAYMRHRYSGISPKWVLGKYLYRWLDQFREIRAWLYALRH